MFKGDTSAIGFFGFFFWSFAVLPLLIIKASSTGGANERDRGGGKEEQAQKRQMQDR